MAINRIGNRTSMAAAAIRLFAVLLIVGVFMVPKAKATVEERLCGEKLTSAMEYLCKGKYNSFFDQYKKRSEGK